MGKSNAPIKPKDIFTHAEEFFLSIIQMHKAGPDNLRHVMNPLFASSAFAAELLFKTIICIEKGHSITGHDLYKLFGELSPSAQDIVRRKWNAVLKAREPALQDIEKQIGEALPRDIEGCLQEGATAFERFRYAYEPGPAMRFLLSDLPLVLRRAVLELQPSLGDRDKILPADELWEGTIELWAKGEDLDWATNDEHYNLAHLKMYGVGLLLTKTVDQHIHAILTAPQGVFLLDAALPEVSEKGLYVAVTCAAKEATLYLNGHRAQATTLA